MAGVEVAARAKVDDQLARLCGLRFVPTDMTGHREVLAGIELGALADAVGHALRTCREFPTPSELLGYVDQARARTAAHAHPAAVEREIEPVEIPIPQTDRVVVVTKEYAPECAICLDNGWQPFWCGRKDTISAALIERGVGPNHCGRHVDHPPHEFSAACYCRPTNRTYQRKREHECAAARKRTERDGR